MALLLGGGCGASLSEQVARERVAVLARAATDLDCPDNRLSATAIETKRYPGGPFPTRYAVEGCGTSEQYVWSDHEAWLTTEEYMRRPPDDALETSGSRGHEVPPAAGGVAVR
jgi:hypothetical protein